MVRSHSWGTPFFVVVNGEIKDTKALSQLRESPYTRDPQAFLKELRRQMLASAVHADLPTMPLFDFAPWVCPSIKGPQVYDSERDKGTEKAYRPHHEIPPQFKPAVEEFIRAGGVDQVPLMKVQALHSTLSKLGIDRGTSGFTKRQLQERICSAIESDFGTCSKMFIKPPGTSGGVLFMLCPHGYIYGFKILLRSEGVTVGGLSVPCHSVLACKFFLSSFLCAGCCGHDSIPYPEEPARICVRFRLWCLPVYEQALSALDLCTAPWLPHQARRSTACSRGILRDSSGHPDAMRRCRGRGLRS